VDEVDSLAQRLKKKGELRSWSDGKHAPLVAYKIFYTLEESRIDTCTWSSKHHQWLDGWNILWATQAPVVQYIFFIERRICIHLYSSSLVDCCYQKEWNSFLSLMLGTTLLYQPLN
jgi:hypothetical protein